MEFSFIIKKMQISREKYTNQPILVHCNDGIGRTGTLIACHIISQTLD